MRVMLSCEEGRVDVVGIGGSDLVSSFSASICSL